MIDPSLADFVSSSKLFGLLDEPGRERLRGIAQEAGFAPNETIVREAETSDAFYVLVSGQVRVSAEGSGGDKHLATLGPGAVFGEIAALTGEPRTATIVASAPVRALRFSREAIADLLDDYPNVLTVLHRIGLRRSEDTLEKTSF